MKQFKTIQEILEYCRKYNKYCSLNKKEIAEISADIYLKAAGYLVIPKNAKTIYDELHEISSSNTIGPGNKDYLKVSNKDNLETAILYASPMLKDFLRQNGFSIPETNKKLNISPIKQDADTILSPENKRNRKTRTRSNAILERKIPDFNIPLYSKR